MCNLGEASMGMQAAGAVAGGVGSYFAASGQKIALKGQADVAKVNAEMAEEGAQAALLAGQRQEQAIMLSTANLKGTQRADFAANGIDLSGGGTPTRVLDSTDVMGQIDANTAHANAIREAFGYKMKATNDLNAARTAKATASGISPIAAGATSLLNSAGSVAKSYYSFKKAGAFSASSDINTEANKYFSEDFDEDMWDSP